MSGGASGVGASRPGAAKSVRTLVLEASPVRRAVFLALLPADRFQLHFPTDYQDWSGAFREFAPQVALIWQEDPVRFGSVCARLRAQPGADSVTLIIVSRRKVGITRAQALEAGADGLLLLPTDPAAVQAEIEEALQSRRELDDAVVARLDLQEEAPPARDSGPVTVPPLLSRRLTGTWSEFKDSVDRLYELLESTTHYEILGLRESASAREVTLAFHEAAMGYHPDRFAQLQDGETRRKIYDVFKRMSKAYSVLCDPRLRAQYDQSLAPKTLPPAPAGGGPVRPAAPDAAPGPARTQMGLKFYEMAERSIRDGKYRLARHQLAVLLQLEPGNEQAAKRLGEVDQLIARHPNSE